MSHDLLVQMAYFRLLRQGLATELLARTMVMHLDPMIFCSPDVTFVAKNELMIR